VRNAFGVFRPTSYNRGQAIELAERNIEADLEHGLYDLDEVTEFINENPSYLEALDEIELNTATDTTALLGEAGGAAGVAGASAATAGGSSAVGIGLGTAAVATGVGIGIGVNVATDWGTDEYNPSPGRHYLGPGNTLSGRTPIDSADEIAKYHDELYQVAVETGDISRADIIAIDQFKKDFESTGNWGSFLGRFGLTLKHAFEQKFGVVYPSGLPTHHLQPSVSGTPRCILYIGDKPILMILRLIYF
jgi:hypothetical protein